MLVVESAGAQTARVVLRWSPVEGAQHYQLEVAKDPAFRAVVVRESLEEPLYRWEQLPSTAYYWRVRTVDAEGRVGDWSPSQQIAPASTAPMLRTPANGATLAAGDGAVEVKLMFELSKVLREFRVEVARSPTFAAPMWERRTEADSVTYVPAAPGIYYWRVRGIDLEGHPTPASAPRRFEVVLPAPRPEAPRHAWVWGAEPVALSWAAQPAAHGYQVELVREGRSAPERLTTRSPTLTFSPPAPGEYRWRVAALDARGRTGAFSAAVALRVQLAAPRLLTPPMAAVEAGREEVPDLSFTWTAVEGATAYRGELSRSADFVRVERASARLARPQWKVGGLAPGAYHWRVIAFDAEGHPSAPSPPSQFEAVRLPPLQAPRMLRPAFNASVPPGRALELVWEPVPDGERYEVELAFGTQVQVREARSPRLELMGAEEGDYAVRVRAFDREGHGSGFSPSRHFFFGTQASVRAEVDPVQRPLVADGQSQTLLRVQIFDRHDQPVRGAKVHARTSAGAVYALPEEEGSYPFTYVSPERVPAGSSAEVTFEDRGLSISTAVPLVDRSHRFSATARLGWTSNLGGLSSPSLSLEVGYRTPFGGERWVAVSRVGYYATAIEIPDSALAPPIAARASIAPVSLLALYELSSRGVLTYVGGGPSVQFTQLVVGSAFRTDAVLGAQAVAGLARRIGPGRVCLEVGYLFGALDNSLGRLRTGGVGVSLGYQVDL